MDKKKQGRMLLLQILLLGLILQLGSGWAQEPKAMTFITSDDVSIEADLYKAGHKANSDTLIVVAPGFAQHKGTRNMKAVCGALTATADILIVDFRGNGQSSGSYWFGTKEYLDLEPALKWARPLYRKIYLMGFSIGAYTCVRAASQHPEWVDWLFLISCPTKVEEIVSSGGALYNPLAMMTRKVDYKFVPENDMFFRWGPIFSGKPSAQDLASKLKMSASFLVGSKDALVFERLSRTVFDAYAGPKTWTKFEDGVHAEGMFLQFPEKFMEWFKAEMKK